MYFDRHTFSTPYSESNSYYGDGTGLVIRLKKRGGISEFAPGNAAAFQPWLIQCIPVKMHLSKSTEMKVTFKESCVR